MDIMARTTFAAVLLVCLLSREVIVHGIPVAETRNIVKRATAKTIGFVSGTFSDCTGGNCDGVAPAGVRTRSRACLDQDMIRRPLCSDTFAENCCDTNTILAEPSFEACDPGCGSSATPVLPVGSFEITNSGGSTSNISITMVGSDTTMIVHTLTELDGGSIVHTQTLVRVGNQISSTNQFQIQGAPANTFDVEKGNFLNIFSTANFQINDQSIVTIPVDNNVLRQTGSGDVVEYKGGAAILSNPNISVSISETSGSFWYISPLGIAYEFTGDKISDEMGEGVFFVDAGNMVAIFSQYQPASDLLLSNVPNSYQIQAPAGNELLFRLNSVQDFFIQNASRLNTSGEAVRYENGQFITGSGSFPASLVFIIGSTGFEAFSDAGGQFETSTFVSNYDAVFYNQDTNRILVSTSPVLSQEIMEGQAHLSEGNAAANELTFNGDTNTIEYNGIQLLSLNEATQRINFGIADNIIYSENTLLSGEQALNIGVKQVFFEQSGGFLSSLGRSANIFGIEVGGVFFTDDQGRTVALRPRFSDSINFITTSLDMVLSPALPTAPSSAVFTLYRQGQNVFLRINGMNVLEATNSGCQDYPITNTDTVTYNNGMISITNEGTTIANIDMLTVASSGENVQLLTNAITGYSIDVNSSYSLITCGTKAVLTNTASVQSMVTSANSLAGVVVMNGMRMLFIGSTAFLTLNGDVQSRTLGNDNSVRYRFGTLTIFDNNVESEVLNNINSLSTFRQIDANPMTSGPSDDVTFSSPGMLYFGNGMTFITDIPMINDLLANELATGFAVESNSFNQRVLVADGSDVMILNGVGSLAIPQDQSLRYIPSTNQLQILDSSNNIVQTFSNANNVRTLLLGDPAAVQNLQTMTTINGPLMLYTQTRLGDYFITDNPIVQGLVNNFIPVPSPPVSAVNGGNNNILLTIGNDMFSVNNNRTISSGSTIQYGNSMLTVGSETIPGIDELLVYTNSDAMPRSNTGSSSDVDGPGMLYLNDQSALFTDRQDVIDAVNAITPQAPLTVSRMTDSDGRVQLRIGAQDIIALNERPIENIASTSTVQFSGSTVTITMADNTMMQFPVTMFTQYLTTDTAPQDVSPPQSFTGSAGRLVLTGDTAFFTDRADVINVIDMPVNLITTVGSGSDRQLIVGGENIIRLNMSARVDAGSGEQIVISGMTVTVVDSATSTVLRTFTGLGSITRYLRSDSRPMSNPGDFTIDGPVTIVADSDNGDALITTRSEVISEINTVISAEQPPEVSRMTDSDGRVQLRIGAQDIIALNERPIENIASTSTVQFSGSTVTITMADNTMMQFPVTMFRRYLTTDTAPQDVSPPQSFTGSAGRLVLTGDTAFFTDRADVINIIDMPVNLFTTVGSVPDRQLIVGGENIIRLSMSARVDAGSGEQIVISGMTVTVVDSDTSSVLRTFTGLGSITRYLRSDSRPMSNPGDFTIDGPVTIVADSDNGDALITTRSEVISEINTVISAEQPPEVSRMTDSDRRVQLRIGAQDIIALNERPIENIASNSTVQFSGSTVTITMADNTMMQFPVTMFTQYLTTDAAPQDVSPPQSFSGGLPGRLVLTGDTAFFTDKADVINVIDMPVNLLTTVGSVPDRQLIIGGENIIRLNMSARVDVESGEQIVISGMTVTVVDSTTSSVLRTFIGLGNITRYLRSDSRPMSNPGDATIDGPVTIVADLDNGEALITTRPEVIREISTVIMGTVLPTLDFGVREDGNRTILVIDMMDIVAINEGIIREVTLLEEVMFNAPNMVVVRNFLNGMESGMPSSMATTRLIRYLMSDAGPVTFTDTDSSFKGPATLFYQPSLAPSTVFVTDRPEIAMLLMSTLNNLTALATPEPVTPEPATPMPPVAVDYVNDDGTRWTTGGWSPCSRTCGVGVRIRNVVCRTADGNPAVTCNQPGQRTANVAPATVELCNVVDCPGESRNGVPREETISFSSGQTRAIVRISDTNIADQVFTIDTLSLDKVSGSFVRETIENIDGVDARGRREDFDLRIAPVTMTTDVVRNGMTLDLKVDGETVFVVNPVPRNSFMGDMCFEISQMNPVTYRNRTVTIGSNQFNDILMVITSEGVHPTQNSPPTSFTFGFQENLQSISFGDFTDAVDRPEFQIAHDGVLCVSPEMQSAFIGGIVDPSYPPPGDTGFIRSVVNEFNRISDSLAPPTILPSTSSPMNEVTRTDRVFQVGTPSVSVREDIFYFSLRCQLSSEGTPQFSQRTWTQNGQEIPNNNVKYSITGDTLLIKNINEIDEGNYTCTVTNPVGSDSATTEIIVNPRPVPTPAPVVQPTQPPPPDWVTEPFSQCTEPECGVGFRVRAVVCRDSNGDQSMACDVNNVPMLSQLCNIEDCPGGPVMGGAPEVNVTRLIRPIFNGDVQVTVEVTSSDPTTGSYMQTTTQVYPDETIITQMISRVNGSMIVSTTTTFGPDLLFGRVDSRRTGNRIDIQNIKVVFSVLPELGDKCFNVSANEQFLYTDNRIIYRPNLFDNMRLLVGIDNEGVTTFEGSTNRVFTGPLTLCVSEAQNRAFFTDIPRLGNTILDQYNEVLQTLTPPMIRRVNVNDTTVTTDDRFRTLFADIGQDISAPEGSPIFITVRLSELGNPPPSEVMWMFNGEPLVTDSEKGIFFTSGRYALVIDNLSDNNVGEYTATVSNPAGSDSVTSSVSIVPQEGIIIRNRMSTAPEFNVGIGTSHIINSNVYSSVRVFCDVAVNDNQTVAAVRFLINGVEASISNQTGVSTAGTPNSLVLTQTSLSSGTTIYTCEATVGNTTFTKNSVINVMDIDVSPPTDITFTGDTQLNVGEQSTITCAADGVPAPEVMFNEVRLGTDNVVSDFVFSGNTMTINKAIYGDDSQYCCMATNEAGSISECVTITLMIPPKITRPQEPEAIFVPLPPGTPDFPLPMFMSMAGQRVTIPEGSVLVIMCDVAGSPEPTIMWFVNGVETTEGAMGNNYTITDARQGDVGSYECRVMSVAGTDSLTTQVTVVAPPTVRSSNEDITELSTPDRVVTVNQQSDLFVLDGLDFCIMCDFDPGVPPTDEVVWRRNGDLINYRDACLSFAANRTQLCFESITRPYSDVYSCTVANIAGSDSGSINVIVAESPRIAFPDHQMVPAPGQCDTQRDRSFVNEDVGVHLCVSPAADVLVDCELYGTPKPMATIQWIFNATGEVLSSNNSGITVFPNNSLLISSIAMAEGVGGSGAYICRASNFAGSHERMSVITASGVLPVIDTPRVGNPFRGERFVTSVGSSRQTVTLQRFPEIEILCRVGEGSPSPMISWTVNGVGISNENDLFDIMEDGSLLITGLQRTECAVYTCMAANPLGSVSESVTVCGESFDCLHSGFGVCSQTCGIGVRQATFDCNRTFDGVSSSFDYNFVLRSIRPIVDPETCGPGNLLPCPLFSYQFVATQFSECSQTCGCGRQYRTVKCFIFFGDEQREEVSFNDCRRNAENQVLPSLDRTCNDFPCPEWRTGDFSECSQECGYNGNQTRDVSCVAPANGNLTVQDSFCDPDGRPNDFMRCNRFHCPYHFLTEAWTPCSTTCLGGVRTRRVFCVNATSNQEIDDRLCVRELGEAHRPISRHLCGTGACAAQFAWSTGDFGQCSVSCGNGMRSRTVQCLTATDKSQVMDDMCIANRRPGETTPCFLQPCPGNDCTGENKLCGLVASMGMCSLLGQGNCCMSCPSP